MTWTPTEGMKRSEALVAVMVDELHHNGVPPILPVLQRRMIDVVAAALDQALADGAKNDGIPRSANGQIDTDRMIKEAPSWEQIALKHGGSHAPVGTPDAEFSHEAPDGSITVGIDPAAVAAAAAPKRRGRPPGPGKKKAKAKKAAKPEATEIIG